MTTRRPRAAIVGALAATFAAGLFALPLLGLVLRAPWREFGRQLLSPAVGDAMRLSLVSSTFAVVVAFVLGLPLAAWLASGSSAVRSVVRILVMLPIVLPPIVGGIALLLAFGRNGVVGSWLRDWFDVSLPFTTPAVCIAAAYMGVPFFVLCAEAGLRNFDRRFVQAAASLGAGPARRFFFVVVPMIAPSLTAGALLCWARALGEFCATQMFAGNLAGRTRTMPLACSVAMENEPDLAVLLGLVLAAVSAGVLLLLRHRVLVRP
ncbi:MAG: ABC transporter permease subunit [Planctomycetes bacterium]|nr:ABC transporter permease subunit [Planctomycetota bacterium]